MSISHPPPSSPSPSPSLPPESPLPPPLVNEEALDGDIPVRSYRRFTHRAAAMRLYNAYVTGRFADSRSEPNPADDSIVLALIQSFPYQLLFFQTLWSTFIMLVAYGLSPDNTQPKSIEYWTSRLNVSGSITYGLGWALFVLLGFFIREASNRYWQAQLHWINFSAYIIQIIRNFRQVYPEGTWHNGDLDRITAHLVSLPIALKMYLRRETESEQFLDILHKDDVKDILQSERYHIHCIQLIRAYISASEDDANLSFPSNTDEKTHAGKGARWNQTYLIDQVEKAANIITRIGDFKLNISYTTHLRIFLYIWMFFLPLAIIQSSGWFTVLWSLIISYGIGMLYNIAIALNDPFGYDMQDIKLNRLSAETAIQILNASTRDQVDLTTVIKKNHHPPIWLKAPIQTSDDDESTINQTSKIRNFLSRLSIGPINKIVLVYLAIFTFWSIFVVFISWYSSKDNDHSKCRWWCGYVPVDVSTTAYMSLGIFLLIGLWINDAYGRYWRGLQLWQSNIKGAIEQLGFSFALMCKRGAWHEGDRERIFSFLAAVPYAAKLHLQNSRDIHELKNILCDEDILAFTEADDLFSHAMNVLYGYLNSIDIPDPEITQVSSTPLTITAYSMGSTLGNIEKAVQECNAMHKFPISASFTIHLQVFTLFWLALLPASVARFSGFLSFIYLIPIGYAIINLIKIGVDLADPFGFDREDVPLDMFCNEIKTSIYDLYHSTRKGAITYISKSDYSRDLFQLLQPKQNITENQTVETSEDSLPHERDKENQTIDSSVTNVPSETNDFNEENSTIRSLLLRVQKSIVSVKRLKLVAIPFKYLRRLSKYVPSVSVLALIAITVWNILAVFLSYGLSFAWGDEKRNGCTMWCSPIDVDSGMLANVGFALFLMLGFRAMDSIDRHQEGIYFILDLETNLRCLAIELVQLFKDGLFHENDKERIIAHLAQIPLCFRDQLLNVIRTSAEEIDGFLSKEDKSRYLSSPDQLEYLFQTVQAYLLLQDTNDREDFPFMSNAKFSDSMSRHVMLRFSKIREITSRAIGVKRIPIIGNYNSHQYSFSIFWLMLLPLATTPYAGFFTILVVPIISYGILAIEEIALQLIDPYGTDSIDIPVEDLCINATNSVIEGVQNAKWGCEYYVKRSLPDNGADIDTENEEKEAVHQYERTTFETRSDSEKFSEGSRQRYGGPAEAKSKLQWLTHLRRSVPWWTLFAVTCWTVVAVVLSFLTRYQSKTARWWQPRITVETTVATYISFSAFILVGFYLQAAFNRFKAAGSVWGENLRSSCHSLATQFQVLSTEGTLHKGDHSRIIAHLTVIPLLLKNEIRNLPDIQDVKGLLSSEDIHRIQCADDKINYCLDVIRSYLLGVTCHPELLKKPYVHGFRSSFIIQEIVELENAVQLCRFLRSHEIAHGFVLLLNLLLAIWFFILPFALAESSGWFTIFWVPIVAYGPLGMYEIAKELQAPFGQDLNDLDLDKMANVIVSDMLFVQQHYERNTDLFVRQSEIHSFWKETSEPSINSNNVDKKPTLRENVLTTFELVKNAFSLRSCIAILLWTTFIITIAWVVSKYFPFDDKIEETFCKHWFCSRIALNSSVKEFLAFALFLLLSIRLCDSHSRYVTASTLWSEKILGLTRLLSNRIFESYHGNQWHENDRERIAAHIASYSVALVEQLRNEDYTHCYKEILGEEDCQQLLATMERSDYCIDLIYRYFAKADLIRADANKKHMASDNELYQLYTYLMDLRKASSPCKEIIRIPFPNGYLQHLKTFLFIWILLLPLGMVETSGWLTILWIYPITYSILGLEKWTEETTDPFGYDSSDIPMDDLVMKAKEIVKANLVLFQNGVKDFIRDDRSAFPEPQLYKPIRAS